MVSTLMQFLKTPRGRDLIFLELIVQGCWTHQLQSGNRSESLTSVSHYFAINATFFTPSCDNISSSVILIKASTALHLWNLNLKTEKASEISHRAYAIIFMFYRVSVITKCVIPNYIRMLHFT